MIGRLQGILDQKTPSLLLIDVNGVGYEVQVALSTFAKLPEVGNRLSLYIHFYVREDTQTLYGFYETEERALFRALIKTSGVGPKMALGILSGIDIPSFLRCVETRDTTPLVQLPGIGQKTAERLLLEMAGKLKGEWESLRSTAKLNADTRFQSDTELDARTARSTASADAFEIADAISALAALGYKSYDAHRAVHSVWEKGLSTENLIKKALQLSLRKNQNA